MLRFRQFMVEYLTDAQREKFSKHKMTDKARSDTDHFFGKDNDIVHGKLDHEHQHDKSEVHRAVEHHLGKELSHDEYRSGVTKDKYGRDAKIGRIIKDEKLKNAFASDKARDGAKKKIENFHTSTVRGTEVAGQTNPEPNKEHPNGHSWKDLSCKNIKDGDNKSFLPHEIKNGTVVHRVHDHNGQEIYRAALQPLHHKGGHVMYHVDSEYGIKHPSFTKSAEDTADKLSGEHKEGLFRPKVKVYREKEDEELHPKTNSEHIHKILDHEDEEQTRALALVHKNANHEHVEKGLKDKSVWVRSTAARSKKATADQISKGLKDYHENVRQSAALNDNANAEHLHTALSDKSDWVRSSAAHNPNANKDHLDKAMNDTWRGTRMAALSNPNANAEHIHKGLKDHDSDVREVAINNPNSNAEHLHKALADTNTWVRKIAAAHPNANAEHLHKALDDEDKDVRRAAINHSNIKPEHIEKALKHEDPQISGSAFRLKKKLTEK